MEIGDAEQMQTYIHSYSRKPNSTKVCNFKWLKEKQMDEIIGILNHQELRKILGMNGCIYLDLVNVFYTNLQFVGQNMSPHVKGVDMLITPKEWFDITGLRHEGQKIERKALENFNKTQFFKTCMRNPNEEVKCFGVGKL